MSKHVTSRKVVPTVRGLWPSLLKKSAPPAPPPPPPLPPPPPRSDTILKWIDGHRVTLDACILEANDLKRDIPRQERVRDNLQKRLDGMGARHHMFNTEKYQMDNKVLPKLRRLNNRRQSLPKERTELEAKIDALTKDLKVARERETKELAGRAKAAEQLGRSPHADTQKTTAQAQNNKRKASQMAGNENAASLEPPKKSRKNLVRVVDSDEEEVAVPEKENATNAASKKRKAPEEGGTSEERARKVAKSNVSRSTNALNGAPDSAKASSTALHGSGNDDSKSSLVKSSSDNNTSNARPGDSSGKSKSKVIGRNRKDISGKGVACAVNNGMAENTSIEKVRGVQKSKKPSKPVKRRTLKGLINHNQSCFSSVVIQLLDAALSEHVLDKVIGLLDEMVETFGLSETDSRKFDSTTGLGNLGRQQKMQQETLRAAIREATRFDATEKVSVAKHLRALLASLREECPGASDKNVSPYLFQSVFAFGAAEDADRNRKNPSQRQELSGDTQEDCFEYYQKVLEVLDADPHTKDSAALKELFEIGTKGQDVCKQEACGHKSDWRHSSENFHSINVPETDSTDAVNFFDLLKASKTSETDQQCPKCADGKLLTKIGYTALPENFVVKLNRTSISAGAQSPFKIETFVHVQPEAIYKTKGIEYEVVAVIRHEGSSTDQGHYNILRKWQDEWYLISDKDCSKIKVEDVKDHKRDGKAAMVMMRKVQK